ncbi:hypothetical protein [Microbulbifer sp. S227A]|uniref:hypothetical protein n=1 Tax=Microbulbifer sp. S227A TaxID=3415131 RepID=UPI003C7E0CFD
MGRGANTVMLVGTMFARWFSTFAFLGGPGFYHKTGVNWLLFPYSAIQITGIALALNSISGGLITFYLGVLLIALCVGVYSFVGGSRAVVRTDVIQGFIFALLMIGAMLLVIGCPGGWSEGWLAATTAKPELFAFDGGAGKYITLMTLWTFGWVNANPLSRCSLIAPGEQLHISSYPPVWPTRPSEDALNYDNRAANHIRAAGHCFEAKCFGIVVASPFDRRATEAVAGGVAELGALLDGCSRAPSFFVDPSGQQIGETTEDKGLIFAEIDLSRCIEAKRFHDVAAGYNRFGVFDLGVRRIRDVPAHPVTNPLDLPFDADEMLAGLRPWIETESPTFDAAAVNRMMDLAQHELAVLGARVERIPGRAGIGDSVRATLPHPDAGQGGFSVCPRSIPSASGGRRCTR